MYITIQRERKYFGKNLSFEDFIEYFKKNTELIFNYENENIIMKFKKFYESLIDGDGYLEFKHIRSKLYKYLNLKVKRNVPNGFIERGFSNEEIKKMEKDNVIDFLKKNGYLILVSGTSYNDSKVKSKVHEYPRCNLCGSELCYHFVSESGLLTGVKCSDPNCKTNKSNALRWKYIYGEEVYKKTVEKLNNSKILNVNYWINKGYSENESIKIISDIQSKNSKMVKNRRSVKKGEVPDSFFKERSWMSVEYWVKNGYTEEEAKNIISQKQKNISNKNHYNGPTCRSKEYWINSGYSEEDAKKKVSEIQSNFSLEKCIKKYGQIEGERIWEERQIKWQNSMHKNGNFHVGYSGVSQKLFDEILNYYMDEHKDYVFYGRKNKEYSLWCEENKHAYVYDFTDLEQRKMIEFDGDIYHANPQLFKENDTPNPFKKGLTSKEIWENDDFKNKVALKNGFAILHVWESDYRNNPNEILKKCLNFLELC